MLRTLFIVGVLLLAYFTFVSPMLSKIRNVAADKTLQEHILTLEQLRSYDSRSFDKGLSNLKSFFMYYSNTFSGKEALPKLKIHRNKVEHYFQRMVYRLPNDAQMEYDVNNAVHQMIVILDNYIMEASDRHDEYYFQSTI